MLRDPDPILTTALFPVEREQLLALLASLEADEWSRPTIADGWTVKDIAAHLVADDLGRLSAQRDAYVESAVLKAGPIDAYIDERNERWVSAMRRLSPRVLQSLLRLGGDETQRLLESLDPFAIGTAVAWVGPGPAPVWLDIAREFTERWHHQQQIRQALHAPLLTDVDMLRSVLQTFAFALVPAVQDVDADVGSTIGLEVRGNAGGTWTLVREADGWRLQVGRAASSLAYVTMDADAAWRMYVRAIPRPELERRSTVSGDERVAAALLDAFALVS
jgi:uncharacterized protein (TIGR03083 family)